VGTPGAVHVIAHANPKFMSLIKLKEGFYIAKYNKYCIYVNLI